MFIDFAYVLRAYGIKVTTREVLDVASALRKSLHETSLTGFYYLTRSLWVKRASDLDTFDQVFAHHFRGVEIEAQKIKDELLEWLKEAWQNLPELTEEERKLAESMTPEEIEELLRQRLEEQKERHDGGNKWIGTGGKSPFGHSGAARQGIRVGGTGGNRSAIRVASARQFRGYRDDVILDTRQLQLALKKLQAFVREGMTEELDVDGTIEATAANGGELEVKVKARRRSNMRIIVMMDVGGSMDPHALLCSRLFSALKKSSHFRDLRTYYFHNCVYGQVFESSEFREPVSIPSIMKECETDYRLVMLGDALMAPYELLSPGAAVTYGQEAMERKEGVAWLADLRQHFRKSVWLNPEPENYWHGTASYIGQVFPMFPLTLSGLDEAVAELKRGS